MNRDKALTIMEGEVYRRLAQMINRGEPGVLATVIRTSLSTPRHPGSKMIIHPDGSVTGSTGGGASEAQVIADARLVLGDGQCRNLELDLAGKVGICGGKMEVFLEPVLRTTVFVVIGAGHVGRALLEIGRTLPFRFVVVDDRPEFLTDLEGLPGIQAVHASAGELAAGLRVEPRGAVLVASRSHDLDGDYFEAIMEIEAAAGLEFAFLGGLGSRSKAAVLRRRFADRPEHAERMKRVQLPVGVEIGAETPAEIALSIFTEVLAVLRRVDPLVDEEGRPVGLRLRRRREAGSS